VSGSAFGPRPAASSETGPHAVAVDGLPRGLAAAWPGQLHGPPCMCAAGATGRGHCGRKGRGGTGGHDSPAARVLQGWGRGHECGGEGAAGKKISSGAHPIGGAWGGAVGRRGAVAVDGGGAGTVVADDGALALHHGEGESEVRWG
jgi:hypothetical protein